MSTTANFDDLEYELDDETSDRRAERVDSHLFVAVINDDDGTPIGHIINISESGVAVVCRQLVVKEQIFKLRLEGEINPDYSLRCDVKTVCRWIRPGKRPGISYAGFEFLELSKKSILRIKNIINALKEEL